MLLYSFQNCFTEENEDDDEKARLLPCDNVKSMLHSMKYTVTSIAH